MPFLLHPKATLLAVAAGCAAIAVQVTTIVGSLESLNNIPAVAKYVAPTTAVLTASTVVLGALSAICIVLSGIGRSPVGSVDAPASAVQISAPANSITEVRTVTAPVDPHPPEAA